MFLETAKKLAEERGMSLVNARGYKQLELIDRYGHTVEFLHQDQIAEMDEEVFVESYLEDSY